MIMLQGRKMQPPKYSNIPGDNLVYSEDLCQHWVHALGSEIYVIPTRCDSGG